MPGPMQGTGYSNLQSIIAANQGNQLGNTVQQGIQKGISGLQSNINQSQNQFTNDVNNANLNTQANQQNVSNAINSIVPQAQTAPQQVTSSSTAPQSQNNNTSQSTGPTGPTPATPNPTALSNPNPPSPAPTSTSTAPATTPASSSDNSNAPGSFGVSTAGSGSTATPNTYAPSAGTLAQFGQYLQGGYNGPTQLNNYNNLQSQAQALQQQGQQVNTQGGLQALLQQYVGGPQYTQGEQNLDTILLGQTGQGNLQNILNATQGLSNLPQTAEAQAAALAQQTATGNQQFAQNTQNQLAAAQTPILQQIQNQVNAQNSTDTQNMGVAQQIYNLLNSTPGNTPAGQSSVPIAGHGPMLQTGESPSGANTPGMLTGPNINTPYGFFNNPNPGIGGPITGAMWNPSTGQVYQPGVLPGSDQNMQTVNQALALAEQNNFINSGTQSNLYNYLLGKDVTNSAFNPLTTLEQANVMNGYTPGQSTPQYTLQQGANAQQAAQMNALQQLAGQAQTYGTYGGMSPFTPTFNFNNVAGFNPSQTYNTPTVTLNPFVGGTTYV